MSGDFADSQEATFRRLIRDAIRKGPFTKSERDVTLAFINHWFRHRNGSKRVIHPGREKLAKKAGVAIKTVSRCLDVLRHYGAIEATACLDGLHGKATEYTVDVVRLLALCSLKKDAARYNGGTNVPTPGRDKMSRRSCDVVHFPAKAKPLGGRA
jgi:hypothetical protein